VLRDLFFDASATPRKLTSIQASSKNYQKASPSIIQSLRDHDVDDMRSETSERQERQYIPTAKFV
jgi:hypothetical protein